MFLRFDWRAPIYPVDPLIDLPGFMEAIRFECDEIVGVFREGRLILQPKRGKPDAVDLVAEEVPFLQGAVVVHNHPMGGPPSGPDAFVAAEGDVTELRAVSPEGEVFSLIKPFSGWPASDMMRDAGDGAILVLQRENARRMRAGTAPLTRVEENALLFRERERAFAALGVRLTRQGIWE